jgi:putative salt-induced outer membrane protein YdiY
MTLFLKNFGSVVRRFMLAAVVAYGCLAQANAVNAQAQAQAPADNKSKTAWHGDLALGLSVTQGNSKTLTSHGSASATKLLTADEFRLGVEGTYGLNNFGASNETRNAENVHGLADYKHLFSDRFFGDLNLDVYHDDVADIQRREMVGPSVGYYLIKSDASRLNGMVGANYVHLRQNHSDTDFFTAHLGERGEHLFSKTAKVWEEVNYYPKVDNFAQYLLTAEAGGEAAMNSRLSLRVVFQDRYNSKPAPGKVPNDLAIISALVWKY